MGFLDKVKGLVGQHDDKVDEGLDKAAELAKDHVPDEHDDKVDMAAEKAKDLLFVPVGQIVGRMNQTIGARDQLMEIVEEYLEVHERMCALMPDAG